MTAEVLPAVLYLVYGLCLIIFLSTLGRQDMSEVYSATTKRFAQSPFRVNPDKVMQDVRGPQQVYEWATQVFIPQLYGDDVTPNKGPTSYNVTLGEYSVVMLGRVSMKRVKIGRHESKAFANAYSVQTQGKISAYSRSSHENSSDFGDAVRTFKYAEDEGFAAAGGYVEFIDFKHRDKVESLFRDLQKYQWFDLSQGTFTIEMMVYSGNAAGFLVVSFIFEHDYSGKTKVTISSSVLDLTLHDMDRTMTWVRFVLYGIIIVLFCYFVKTECEELSYGVIDKCSSVVTLLHALSLSMCLYCIIKYLTVVVSHAYLHYEFPQPEEVEIWEARGEGPAFLQAAFQDLVNLANSMENFCSVLSVKTFLVCLKCCTVMKVLVPQCGLFMATMLNVKGYLLGYIMVFGVCMSSFTLAGYYLFGYRIQEWSTMPGCLVTAIRMVMMDPNLQRLFAGDEKMAYPFFIGFHLLFLVLQQVVHSFWLFGYIQQRALIEQLPEDEKYPVLRAIGKVFTFIHDNVTCISRIKRAVEQAVLGPATGAAGSRINHDKVAAFRDRRQTQLRTRVVQYEQKQDDELQESFELLKDITFRAVPALYPEGLMQFYVESVTPGGQASDAGVQVGFRLVEIETSTQKDKERFRSREMSLDPMKTLRDLKKLPLSLRFEGQPKPYSCECVFWFIFAAVLLPFALLINRRSDSFVQYQVFDLSLGQPQWRDASLTRSMEFDRVASMSDVDDWIDAAIIGQGYSCVDMIGEHDCDIDFGPMADGRRQDWFLWRGVGFEAGLPGDVSETKRATAPFEPAAAIGLSAGYIPLLPPLKAEAEDVPLGELCATEEKCDADEKCDDWCSCKGFVRMGIHGVNFSNWMEVDGDIECSEAVHGKVHVGTGHAASQVKHCYCMTATTAAVKSTVLMNDFNIGVMPNNFVRLTFQVPCYVESTNERWKWGVLHLLDSKHGDCMDGDCKKNKMNSEDKKKSCIDRHGLPYEADGRLTGEWSGINYTFAMKNSYANQGGFSVGFGTTRQEAMAVAQILRNDQVLIKYATEAVFELVTYNPNFDLFTYAKVSFDTRPTGLLGKAIDVSTFPLRAFTMGNVNDYQGDASFNWVLFVVLWVLTVALTLMLARDLLMQKHINKAMLRPSRDFIFDFFKEEWWNVLDVTIWALTLGIIITLLSFILIDSRTTIRTGVSSWTTNFNFNLDVSLLTQDLFNNFARAAGLYDQFQVMSALVCWLIVIRLVKYLKVFISLGMIMKALGRAIIELIVVIGVAAIGFFGAVLMFFIYYGVVFSNSGTLGSTFCNLFLFIMGRFSHQDDLIQWSPYFSFFFYPLFYILFFFMLNMLLAAIVFSWRDMRRDAQELSIGAVLSTMKDSVKMAEKETESAETKPIDREFWQALSILKHIHTLDDKGKVTAKRDSDASGGRDTDDQETICESDGEASGDGFNQFESNEEGKKFVKVFRRAYMELAASLARELGDEQLVHTKSARDSQHHDGASPRDRPHGAHGPHGEEPRSEIGIIEGEVSVAIAKDLVEKLQKQMTELSHVSEEVWLDALLSALEARGIDLLQRTFLPVPCLMPKKQQEWNAFKDKQLRMQRRLDIFLQLLQQEAVKQHYVYLAGMSLEKERVLKQQSLVLTDYLETLDAQINKVSEERQDLETKRA